MTTNIASVEYIDTTPSDQVGCDAVMFVLDNESIAPGIIADTSAAIMTIAITATIAPLSIPIIPASFCANGSFCSLFISLFLYSSSFDLNVKISPILYYISIAIYIFV